KLIKARLKGYDGVTAKLEMGGLIYPVSKDKLSAEDQAYLDAWLSRQPGALPQGQMPSLSDTNLASAPKLDLRAIEKLVHAAVNRERLKVNLREMAWNDQVAAIARSHSEDMAKRNFFSHFNPEGETPSARAARQGWTKSKGTVSADESVSGLAENIGRVGRFHSLRREVTNGKISRVVFRWYTPDQMAAQIVKGWLNSPRHRKNMLDPERELEGIGLGVFREHVFVTQNLF
ncbi:MAG: CAP domain-containing protein, partial [Opitutales bacterium]